MSRTSNLTRKPVTEVLAVLNSTHKLYDAAARLGVAPGTLNRFIRTHNLKRVVRVEWTVNS